MCFSLQLVQVLSGHQNDNGVYSLYVTDYTRNEFIPPVSASWCAPALSGLVLKIEMWKEAAIKGPEMKPGDYYEIKNVRIKESSGGYWEGSFSEVRKLRKLDEEELEEEPNLVELLKYVPAPHQTSSLIIRSEGERKCGEMKLDWTTQGSFHTS